MRLSRHYLPEKETAQSGTDCIYLQRVSHSDRGEMIHYGMTQTAQLAIARGLAEITAGTNVTVNPVLPGPTAPQGANNFVEKFARDQKTTRG